MVGLERGKVELVPYNPEWEERYNEEVEHLDSVAGDFFVEYEHIGSTAIEGMPAKPIIDILGVVEELDEQMKIIGILEENGYEHRPDTDVSGRLFFAKGPRDNRTHYLSVSEYETEFYEEKIAFRDYLRENAEARDEYASLKRELAEKHADNREKYTEEKTEFIEKVLERAIND